MTSTVSRLSTILVAMASLSCGTLVCVGGPCDAVRMDFETRMIVPNAYSVTRGTKEVLGDIDECDAYSRSEQGRLLTELRIFDPYLDKYAGRTSTARSLGGSVGRGAADGSIQVGDGVHVRGTPPRRGNESMSQEAGRNLKENAASAAGSFLAELVVEAATYDASKQPLMDLETDIAETSTFMRFEYTCLRAKGYRIDEFAEDGTGAAYLEPELLRVTLREPDCSGTVMYERPQQEDRLLGAAEPSDVCTPAPLELASVSAGGVTATSAVDVTATSAVGVAAVSTMPRAELPGDLARIESRPELTGYLGVDPECVDSRSEFQLCSWRGIGKGQKSWKQLAKQTNTKRRVNVICELPTRGSFRTPDSCQIYPRETRRPPVLRDDAREPALALLRDADGIAAMSRLVGDGPVDCEALGDGSQTCRWIASNQAQGYGLVGTAAQTKKQAEVTCRFSSTTGATVPASCEASQRR